MADFVNPSGLRSVGGNLYQQSASSGEPMPLEAGQDGVHIRQYALESSNVNVAEELILMIATQRAYELNSKAVQAADESMRVVASLRR